MALSRSDCDSRTPASRFGESSQSAAVSVDATSSTVKDVVIWFGSKVYLKISGLEFIARKKIARANFKSRCFEKKSNKILIHRSADGFVVIGIIAIRVAAVKEDYSRSAKD